MKLTYHNANNRGKSNLGWLESRHSFSFGQFFNPELTNFGLLRVLNDDQVAPKMGFGKHPHQNMEIVSIPLSGSLKHKDSMGNETIIKKGEIQVMSAGTGIEHSEFNNSRSEPVHFLQIWIFPNESQLEPRYDQQLIPSDVSNKFSQILSPNPNDEGVWIHQQAWMNVGKFTEDTTTEFKLHETNHGLYIFVLEGEAEVAEQHLGKRDAIGIWDTTSLSIKAKKGAEILTIEVPMK